MSRQELFPLKFLGFDFDGSRKIPPVPFPPNPNLTLDEGDFTGGELTRGELFGHRF